MKTLKRFQVSLYSLVRGLGLEKKVTMQNAYKKDFDNGAVCDQNSRTFVFKRFFK